MHRVIPPAIPAGFFGMVLGIAALSNDWRLATQVYGCPIWVGEFIGVLALVAWLTFVLLYGLKWVLARGEALAEFRHPVLCCFVGLVPVSTALISLTVRPYSEILALILAAVGIAGQLLFGVFRTGELWKGGRDVTATTPVLYLPTVAGSFVSTIVLSAFGYRESAAVFFGAGVLSWLAIESVLIHRLYLNELPAALRPTLGIQLAPPTVGCVAYLSLTSGRTDWFAAGLIGYGLFQLFVLIRLSGWIRLQPFSPSYWAFSFGVAALPGAMMRFGSTGRYGPIAMAAPYVFAFANLVIGALMLATVWLLFKGRLLPPPLAVPLSPAS
jgi:tellurite resistance protein